MKYYFLCLVFLQLKGLNSEEFIETGQKLDEVFEVHDQVTKEESCVCGQLGPPPKIVGGNETNRNEFPWMAALLYNGRLRCGATLVNDRFLVTAAHCVVRVSSRFMSIYLGAHDVSNSYEWNRVSVNVANIIVHPEYNAATHMNDIALLELTRPVQFSDTVKPACLPPGPHVNYYDQNSTIVGWGRIKEGSTTSPVLMKAYVPVIHPSVCRKNYRRFRIDGDKMLCAGLDKGGIDACQGDSGGPLLVEVDGHYTLAGVVSFGEGCARPEKPGVYARVAYYVDFIEKNSKDALFCPAYKGGDCQKN